MHVTTTQQPPLRRQNACTYSSWLRMYLASHRTSRDTLSRPLNAAVTSTLGMLGKGRSSGSVRRVTDMERAGRGNGSDSIWRYQHPGVVVCGPWSNQACDVGQFCSHTGTNVCQRGPRSGCLGKWVLHTCHPVAGRSPGLSTRVVLFMPWNASNDSLANSLSDSTPTWALLLVCDATDSHMSCE